MGAIVEWGRFDIIDCWWSKGIKIFLGMMQNTIIYQLLIILCNMVRIYIYDSNSFFVRNKTLKISRLFNQILTVYFIFLCNLPYF